MNKYLDGSGTLTRRIWIHELQGLKDLPSVFVVRIKSPSSTFVKTRLVINAFSRNL